MDFAKSLDEINELTQGIKAQRATLVEMELSLDAKKAAFDNAMAQVTSDKEALATFNRDRAEWEKTKKEQEDQLAAQREDLRTRAIKLAEDEAKVREKLDAKA